MSLTGQDRAQFVSDYSRALVTSWSNEAFSRQLDDEPTWLTQLDQLQVEGRAG